MTTKPVKLPCSAEILLPHRPPMLFLDTLDERYGDRAIASAEIPISGFCFDDKRGLLPEFLIEIMAQTIAAANGYDILLLGVTPKNGFIVGVDSFVFHAPVPASGRLTIDTEKTFSFGAVTIIQGKIFFDKLLLAEGSIKVWEEE